MKIIVIGPQGSGKGTQAKLLSKLLDVPHVSTGDIFRAMRTDDSDLARTVTELIDKGNLVPDELTNKIVQVRLSKPDVAGGFILDGYPRNLAQVTFLDGMIGLDRCVLIDVSDSECMARIAARRICPGCQANYNTVYIKPKVEGICDGCGSMLVMRDDDKPEYVSARLDKYHSLTEPIIDHYERVGKLLRINGEKSIEAVFEDIKRVICAAR